MRLLFAGTPEVALPALDRLLAGPHEVVAVLTRPDAGAGRGRRTAASPVAERAEAAGLEVLRPPSPRDPGFQRRLAELAPDCAPVVAYGALLPETVLGVPAHGWVNLHFSLLPAWRGAAPVQHALLAGDEVTGATTFRIVQALDAGPVLGTTTESVRPADTAGDLLGRLATSGAELLAATLDGLESGRLHGIEQPADGITFAPRVTVDDARVRWDDPAFAVDRRIRACTPAPGRMDDPGRRAAQARPGRRSPTPSDEPALAPGEIRVARRDVLVGHRHRAGPARPGAAARPQGGGRPRLGPRRAARRRRPARHVSGASPRADRPRVDRPRATALAVLRAVRERDAYVNLELPRLLRERGLGGRDAAFATELTHGTIRRQGTYDAVLEACLDRPIARLDPDTHDVLRLGCHQLLLMRTPAHAAVSTSVAMARSARGPGAGRLVNAVLRRVAGRDLDGWLAEVAPDAATDPDGHLAVVHSHPVWIVRAMREALADDPTALLEADNAAPAVTLVARPGLVDVEELVGCGRRPRAAGRRTPRCWPVATPGRSLRCGTAARACRTRAASWWCWRWLQHPCRAATSGGSTCAPAREARRPCWVRWRRLGAPGSSPRSSRRTGPTWCGRRSKPLGDTVEVRTGDGREVGAAEPGGYDRVLVDAPVHRAGGAAPASGGPLASPAGRPRGARPAAARAAGLRARRHPSRRRGRLRHLLTPPGGDPRRGGRRRRRPSATSSRSTPPPCCRSCPRSPARPCSCGRTCTAPTRCSAPCSAAADAAMFPKGPRENVTAAGWPPVSGDVNT